MLPEPTSIIKVSSYWSYDHIIKEDQEDLKSWYRLGHAIAKEKSAEGYRWRPEDSRKQYARIRECFRTVIQLYAKKRNPPSCFKEYIHSCFGIAKDVSDEIVKTFDLKWDIKIIWKRQKINIHVDSETRQCVNLMSKIEWGTDDLAEANTMIQEVKKGLGYPEEPEDTSIDRMASEKEPVILPFHIYYRQAKVYLAMALCYNSNIYVFYKLRQKDEQKIWDNFQKYWTLALRNAQWALMLRKERQAKGFKDSGGASHEAELLAIIYCRTSSISTSSVPFWYNRHIDIVTSMEALYHEWTQPKVQDHVDERGAQSAERGLALKQDVQHHQETLPDLAGTGLQHESRHHVSQLCVLPRRVVEDGLQYR